MYNLDEASVGRLAIDESPVVDDGLSSSGTLTRTACGELSDGIMDKEIKSPLADSLSEFPVLEAPGKEVAGPNGRLDPALSSRTGMDGLLHLRKLLGVMERMEALREANQHLQQKCAFLEDTKMLLKVQNIQLLMEQSEEEESRGKRQSNTRRKVEGQGVRSLPAPRRNSANARRSSLAKMHQQTSQSVSSLLELVDLDLSRFDDGTRTGTRQKEGEPATQKEPRKSRSSEERRSLKLQETWRQVKKVFSGRSESTTAAGSRSEHGAVCAELLLRTNSRRASGSSSTQSLNHKGRSCSVSGDCLVPQTNQNAPLSPVRQDLPLDEEPSSLRTPSIVLAEPPQRRSHPHHVASSTASDAPSRNGCFEIPEEGTAPLRPGDDSDDSAFTPWVQRTPKRRQSGSPTSVSQPPRGANTGGLLSVDSTSVHLLGRSSSFKVSKAAPEVGSGEDPASKSLPSTPVQPTQTSADSNPQGHNLLLPDAVARKTRGPWGMVKGIIQTRRESLKSRSGKGEDDPEDPRAEESQDVPAELTPTRTPRKLNSRKMSVTPNLPMRFAFFKNAADTSQLPTSAGGGKRYSLSSTVMSPGSPVDLATLFGVNDEFTKKMQEWEEKKKKIITKGSPVCPYSSTISGSTKFSVDFIRKMEEWEQKKGLGGCKPGGGMEGASPCRMSPEGSGNPLSSPPPTAPTTTSGEEIPRFLSESFSRTVQDWEEVRRRRHSQSKEREKSKGKMRSTSGERDKSQQRVEKQLKKLQKKELKLEEELKKLGELRMKLDQQLETSSTSERIMTERRTSQEAPKTEGWTGSPRSGEGRPKRASTGDASRSRHPRSAKYGRVREEAQGLSTPGSPSIGSGRQQSGSPSQSSLDSLSSVESQSLGNAETTRSRDGSLQGRGRRRSRRTEGQRMASSDYRRTVSSPGSRSKGQTQQELMEVNSRTDDQLRRRVDEKDEELSALQNEVHQLTKQINNLNRVYSETIDQFQRELWSSSRLGQSDEVSVILSQLTNRLDLLQQHGDRMAKEISQTQTKICKEANNRRQNEQQLFHNLEQLHWIIESPTATSSLAEIVLHLCSYVTKLLSKGSVLRQCISERNLLVHELERHLLVQEVINKLLQADIERHSLELSHLKEFQRLAVIKRWKTFNGSDHVGREELTSETSRSHDPVFPKIPQSSKKVQALLTQMVNDPESLDIDTDWLTTIRRDAELALNLVTRGVQTDCPTGPPQRSKVTTHASAQTVMTFCDCDYVPTQLPSPSDPFRRVSSTPASTNPPLFITPSCNSPSSTRNTNHRISDKCFLSPDNNNCDDRNSLDYKPRKSSAPDFSTDEGDDQVWLRSSAFRAISSSYSEHIDGGQTTPRASNAHQGLVPTTTSALASLGNVHSARRVGNFRTDVEPQLSGVRNLPTRTPCKVPQLLSHKETTIPEDALNNLTIVDKLTNPTAHSPVLHSKCCRKQGRGGTGRNQRQGAEGCLLETSNTRGGFVGSRSCDVDRVKDDDDGEREVGEGEQGPGDDDTGRKGGVDEGAGKVDPGWEGPSREGPGNGNPGDKGLGSEGPGKGDPGWERPSREGQGNDGLGSEGMSGEGQDEEDTDVVFGGSEDSFCWHNNLSSLRETNLDESNLPERPDEDGSDAPDRSRHSLGTVAPSLDQRRTGSWSNGQDPERRGQPPNRPIVVRQLKSATELMHDNGQKRMRPTSVPHDGKNSSHWTHARGTAPDTTGDRPKMAGRGRLQSDSFEGGGGPEGGGAEDSVNGSSGGSDGEKYAWQVGGEEASPATLREWTRFKPITPVLRAAARGARMATKSSAIPTEARDPTASHYPPTELPDVYHDDGSWTSSCSSIPTVEAMGPPSSRHRAIDVKETRMGSPEMGAASRGSRKGSRSQPAQSPRAGGIRAARSMCRALCLQAMSVELTDDSTDSSLSHPFTPHAYSTPLPYLASAPVQSASGQMQSTSAPIQPISAPVEAAQQEPDFHKGRGNWLLKPKRLFKALK